MADKRYIPFGDEEMFLECQMTLEPRHFEYYFPSLSKNLPEPFIFVEVMSDIREGADYYANDYLFYRGKRYVLMFKNTYNDKELPEYHITSPGYTVACNQTSINLILDEGYSLAIGRKGKHYLMDPFGKIKGQVR